MAAARQGTPKNPSANQMTSTTPPEAKALPPFHSIAARRHAPGDVVVEIGPTKIKYRVQEAFLIHYSDYFRKARSGPWKEAEEKVIPLDDVEPATFNLLVEWLYIQQLPASFLRVSGAFAPEDLLAIMLYVFADRFLVSSLRELLNREIVHRQDLDGMHSCKQKSVIYAFKNPPAGDPILDFLVDQHYIHWSLSHFAGNWSDFLDRVPHNSWCIFSRGWAKDATADMDAYPAPFT